MKTNDIYIVIPAFDEQPRLPELIKQIKIYYPLQKVIVVDDGSEPPLKVSSSYPITLLRHRLNLGKGIAMKTGIEYAFSKGAGSVIFLDADLQHDPKEIPEFVSCLNNGYDIVFGSRRPNIDTPLVRYLGNKFASLYIRLFFGVYISDILSGYRALTKKSFRYLNWKSERYGVETEIVARLGKNQKQLKWTEIPIDNIYKDKYKGVTLVDSVKILATSLWWKLF